MKKYWGLIVLIVILAFSLRFYAASTLPVDYDEPVYYTAANKYAMALQYHNFDFIPQIDYNYEHPVLAKLVYGAAITGLPLNEPDTGNVWQYLENNEPLKRTVNQAKVLLMRCVSVLFGTLEVATLALISPLAALMLAIDSITIKYTSVIYLEALPAFLSIASVALFGAALPWLTHSEKTGIKKNLQNIGLLLLSALCLGAAVASKYQYAIAGVAIAVYFLYLTIRHRPKDLTRYALLLAFTAAALLFFYASDPYLYGAPIQRLGESLNYSVQYSGGETVQSAGYPFYQPLVWLSSSVTHFLDMPVQAMPSRGNEFIFKLDTLIFVLAIFGLVRMWKKHPLFLVWLGIGLIFLLIWNTKWPQYTLLITAPLCIAAADGVTAIFEFIKKLLTRKNKTITA